MLGDSDAISLHLTLSPATRHIIGAEALRCLKPGAFIVNTARGGLVDDTALAAALADGSVSRAIPKH
jgi:phosphoglycerate dehydrogenase-like enzyme